MKFYGIIGFWEEDHAVAEDVWEPLIVEREYFGDISRNYRKFQPTQQQNDDFTVNAQISILADLYARQNWQSIRYVIWNGVKWKVNNVDGTQYPRLTMELGGVYNGEETNRI